MARCVGERPALPPECGPGKARRFAYIAPPQPRPTYLREPCSHPEATSPAVALTGTDIGTNSSSCTPATPELLSSFDLSPIRRCPQFDAAPTGADTATDTNSSLIPPQNGQVDLSETGRLL
jgi:hypothetical protein